VRRRKVDLPVCVSAVFEVGIELSRLVPWRDRWVNKPPSIRKIELSNSDQTLVFA
jgi:hypothetical protein